MFLLRNTSWSAAGNITIAIGRLGIAVILARRLGPEAFGLFVFVQWLIDMAFLSCSIGLTGVATRFFPQSAGTDGNGLPGFNRWFLRVGALAVLLSSFLATLSVRAFADLSDATLLAAVAFWAATYSIWALLGARAQGLFQFKRFAGSSATFVCVAFIGLAIPRSGTDLLAAILVLTAANLAAAGCFATNPFRRDDASLNQSLAKEHSKLIHRYAMNAWLTSIVASLVWARGEISLVKGLLGESAVGYYSIGLTLTGLVNQGVGLLTGALWPQIARAWDKGNRDELLRFSNLVTSLLMAVAGLSAGVLICFAPYIIALLFGERFLQSSTLVLILALGPLGLVSGCAHLVIQAATNGRFARDITVAAGVALFGAAFVLIPLFGMEGAATTRSVIQVGVAVLTLAWVTKLFGPNAGTSQNLRSFVLLVTLAASLVVFISAGPQMQIWGRLALFAGYCCLVCLVSFRIWESGSLHELRKFSGAPYG